MLRPEIHWKNCQICQPCLVRSACNVRAVVTIDQDEPPYIDLSRCNGCGSCITACPHQAIVMQNSAAAKQIGK